VRVPLAMLPSSLPSFQPEATGAAPCANHSALVPLLEFALSESNAQGAYLYSIDLRNAIATLVVWSGLPPAAATSVDLQGRAVQSRFWQRAPVVFRADAWKSAIFKELPEFRQNRFEGVVSAPLLDSGQVIGRFNLCQSEPVALNPREFSSVLNLSFPIAALLAATSARDTLGREIEKLTRQLADRKLFERAKGIIHARFDCTEEQAYFCIRNLSRRRRTPMRQIAAEIVATSGSRLREDTRLEAWTELNREQSSGCVRKRLVHYGNRV